MQVEVRVFATLRRHLPELKVAEPKRVEVPPGTTIRELRDRVGLPPEEVRVVMRNYVQADLDEQVEDGDRVTFIPAVAGG
jgi:molybdopterin synthase sulfur carrier subunit